MCKFMSEIQFLIGRRPMRSYSPGAFATIGNHCPMEVGAYDSPVYPTLPFIRLSHIQAYIFMLWLQQETLGHN